MAYGDTTHTLVQRGQYRGGFRRVQGGAEGDPVLELR